MLMTSRAISTSRDFEPIVFAYSRRSLQPEEVPRNHRELAQLIRSDPERFRGKIGTYDPVLSAEAD